MTSEFNPLVQVGKRLFPLLEVCSWAASDAYHAAKRRGLGIDRASEAYVKAYYARMAKLMPDHPALKAGQGS